MDIKHVLSRQPAPAGVCRHAPRAVRPRPVGLGRLRGRTRRGGARGGGFGFDNELPLHQQWLEPYRLADRLVTNGEWLEFMADRGYERHELWLSDGWGRVRDEGWRAPFYWTEVDGVWFEHTLTGTRPVDAGLPVSHVSHYEADAYATGRASACPTEGEWEHAVALTGRRRAPQRRQPRRHRDVPPARGRAAAPAHLRRSTATAGSGRARPTSPTRATTRRPARSGSTTASSCRARWCCAVGAPSLPRATPGSPIATSSRRGRAGPSPACASPTAGGPMTAREPVVTVASTRDWASGALVDDVRRGWAPSRAPSRRSGSTTTSAPSSSTRSPACRSTTRPSASGPSCATTPPTS